MSSILKMKMICIRISRTGDGGDRHSSFTRQIEPHLMNSPTITMFYLAVKDDLAGSVYQFNIMWVIRFACLLSVFMGTCKTILNNRKTIEIGSWQSLKYAKWKKIRSQVKSIRYGTRSTVLLEALPEQPN